MKKSLFVATAITVILGIGFSVEHFFDDNHYNPGFYQFPIVISLHVALGGLYIGLATLQFFPQIRLEKPVLHRVNGRITVGLGVVTSIMAVAAITLFPFSGQGMIFFVAPFACYFGLALVLGFQCARAGNFMQHRRWMIRAFAIATAIATQRLILVPSLIVFGTAPETIRMASMAAFTCAFMLHALVAEIWLHQSQIENESPNG